MTTGGRIQLYSHQDLNPIIKPTLTIMWQWWSHTDTQLSCIHFQAIKSMKSSRHQSVTKLSPSGYKAVKKITSNTASNSSVDIFLCQGLFNQVSTTKYDISVSRLLSFETFSNLLKVSENLVSVWVSDNFVSVSEYFSKQRFPYWFWKFWFRKSFHISFGNFIFGKKSWVQFTGSIRRVVCNDFPNKRTI